jgi:hypothetical protein
MHHLMMTQGRTLCCHPEVYRLHVLSCEMKRQYNQLQQQYNSCCQQHQHPLQYNLYCQVVSSYKTHQLLLAAHPPKSDRCCVVCQSVPLQQHHVILPYLAVSQQYAAPSLKLDLQHLQHL